MKYMLIILALCLGGCSFRTKILTPVGAFGAGTGAKVSVETTGNGEVVSIRIGPPEQPGVQRPQRVHHVHVHQHQVRPWSRRRGY